MRIAVEAEGDRCVALRIEVDDQRLPARLGDARGELTAVVVFPTPPFWFAIA